ncbi:hypothetical protein CPB83DRAFT_874875 [Crepidotus variabilis]|uniref:Uncharacterized protein n=1 Tax=Crepidotus variabilis TaxID=179855 RepID=A0A9P6EJP1_9AGAR|nr:hypothetical protein CPB83DRAFT_874875 [Crepidotus variabilis]
MSQHRSIPATRSFNLDLKTTIEGLRGHHATWNEILKLVATDDVPGLHRILCNAKFDNWSPEKLLDMLRESLTGNYHPQSYNQFEYDLVSAIYELGGDAAVHLLHNSPFALPSRSTMVEHRRHISIRISTGKPKISDILENIKTMFEETQPGHRRVGMTITLDEISCDDRLCYLAETDDIAGLCEHAGSLFPSLKMGERLDVIRAVAAALREGSIHPAQEVLVAAISRNDESGYGARPVLILPTCKRGSFRDAALIIEIIRQAWKMSPFGDVLHGPVWSIASDGDPKRRPALFLHCMARELLPSDPLYVHLQNLNGLNLWVGSGGEVQDLDYKHTFKRICKLLCAREGILVNQVVVNKGLLALWLERLTDVDWSENPIFSLLNANSSVATRIQGILNPKDAQDVPRAVKLLNLTAELRNLNATSFNPSEHQTHRALSLLGEMLGALLEPFVDPTLSLSQQITSLVKFAHLACALYLSHGSSFMPHHLYSDLQCMVRTAVFRVAQSKILDPELKVFLCLLGDDVLEILFGRTRMIGGHKPNVDVGELTKRFESALRLDTIFQKYPHWEQRPRRLKLERARDVDHLSPRNWIGDLVAKNCNLQVCWTEGVRQAEQAISQNGQSISFGEIFSEPFVDLMRPKGGKYPGISAEVDCSLGESPSEVEGLDDIENNFTIPFYDGYTALVAEEQAASARVTPSIWMELEGEKKAHKKTILRLFMDPSFDIDYKKSTDRLLRVRYYSIGGDHSSLPDVELAAFDASSSLFHLGSLYATLICTDKAKVSIAILQCTAIKNGAQSLDRAPLDEVSLPNSSYEVSGQILSLRPHFQDLSNTSAAQSLLWIWDSFYVALNGISKSRTSQTVSTFRNLSFAVHGSIVHPLLVNEVISAPSSSFPSSIGCKLDSTWVVKEETLAHIEEKLHTVVRDDIARNRLPVFGSVRERVFPYTAIIDGASWVHSTNSIPVPTSSTVPQPCYICRRQVSGPDRQNHMGKHILCALRQMKEGGDMAASVSDLYPCGFCGQSTVGSGACSIDIKGGLAKSSCSQTYAFRISSAFRMSERKPCTNVPLKCRVPSCSEVHWKYNLPRHLNERHPSWRNLLPQAAQALITADIAISADEEDQLLAGTSDCEDLSPNQPIYETRRSCSPSGIEEERGQSPRHVRHYHTSQHLPPPQFTATLLYQSQQNTAHPDPTNNVFTYSSSS